MKKLIFVFTYFGLVFFVSCQQQKKQEEILRLFDSANNQIEPIPLDSISKIHGEIMDKTTDLSIEVDSFFRQYQAIQTNLWLIKGELDELKANELSSKIIFANRKKLISMENYFQKMKIKFPSENIAVTDFRNREWIKSYFAIPKFDAITILNSYELQLKKITLKYFKTKINTK